MDKLIQSTCIILCTRQFLVTVHVSGRHLTVDGYLSQTQKHKNSGSSKSIDTTIILLFILCWDIYDNILSKARPPLEINSPKKGPHFETSYNSIL